MGTGYRAYNMGTRYREINIGSVIGLIAWREKCSPRLAEQSFSSSILDLTRSKLLPCIVLHCIALSRDTDGPIGKLDGGIIFNINIIFQVDNTVVVTKLLNCLKFRPIGKFDGGIIFNIKIIFQVDNTVVLQNY